MPFTSVSVRRLLLWVAIATILLWYLAQIRSAAASGRIPLYDFIEYWSAVRILLRGGNPYDPNAMLAVQHTVGWTDSQPIMMWNPPWTLVLAVPFALLPFWTARCIWFVVCLLLLFWSADWLWRHYGGSASSRWLAWLATAVFIPVGTALYLGQITPFILAGVAGFLRAVVRKRWLLAGTLTLLVSVKPHLPYLFWVFLLLWVWRERRWKVLLGAGAALGVSLILVCLFSNHVLVQYLAALRAGPGPRIWQTPTWGVALLMLFPGTGQWLRFVPMVLGVCLAAWLWLRWRGRFAWAQHLPVVLLLSVVTSSFTWMFDWVVLLPAVLLVFVWFQAEPRRLWWLPAGFLCIELALIFQPGIEHSNFYSIWLPPALWLLFAAGKGYGPAESCARPRT